MKEVIIASAIVVGIGIYAIMIGFVYELAKTRYGIENTNDREMMAVFWPVTAIYFFMRECAVIGKHIATWRPRPKIPKAIVKERNK